jgi:dihydroorotate dehydrogenase electron transfer subunit
VKLHPVEVLDRERFGAHALVRYRWTGTQPEAGQFVMARVAASEPGLDPFLARPLFVHDYDGGVASLLFEIRGRGTALLAEEDSELLVAGPSGNGFVLDGAGPVALVGGGVWVSPLKFLSRRLSDSGISYDVYLEVPVDAPRAYAKWLSRSYPDATLVCTDGSLDASRMVLDRLGDVGRYAGIYASGPAEMLAAVRDFSTVPAQLALRERMACANGSCHGCAVPISDSGVLAYTRACVEGPVFPAEVLAW